MPQETPLTLVLDIGKSHAKLLFVNDTGEVLARHGRDNHSVNSPLGYPALDIEGLSAWVQATLAESPYAPRCSDVIATTHGAAFVALDDEGLAWAPLDYEYDAAQTAVIDADSVRFTDTLSPGLPAGLNAARQLAWMQDAHPEVFARTRTLLPYPQYWAWWFSGIAASERSSLGCHTHLWNPAGDGYSALAQHRGWAPLFAPLRRADEVLGPVRPALARETGLPADCRVHVGVHDSNACLARYLRRWPQATLVSSGTWTVIMAPGADAAALDADLDMLGNVSVLGAVTPTARFMGGREHAALCGGAPPEAARLEVLERLLHDPVQVLPSFTSQGGPFRTQRGELHFQGQTLGLEDLGHLSPAARATLASLYCAQVTAWLVARLRSHQGQAGQALVVEGPLAQNPVYLRVLASLLPTLPVHASTDPMEGTARGAWLLAHWDDTRPALNRLALQAVEPLRSADRLAALHRRWCESVTRRAAR